MASMTSAQAANPPHSGTLWVHRVPRPTLAPTPSLLAIRIRHAWTQRMLAEQSHVDRATIGRLEAGALARMDTIYKLAKALKVSAADLQAPPPEASPT